MTDIMLDVLANREDDPYGCVIYVSPIFYNIHFLFLVLSCVLIISFYNF